MFHLKDRILFEAVSHFRLLYAVSGNFFNLFPMWHVYDPVPQWGLSRNSCRAAEEWTFIMSKQADKNNNKITIASWPWAERCGAAQRWAGMWASYWPPRNYIHRQRRAPSVARGPRGEGMGGQAPNPSPPYFTIKSVNFFGLCLPGHSCPYFALCPHRYIKLITNFF